jgi:Tfp pilus assembly protein PilO
MKHIFSRLSKRELYVFYISTLVVAVVFFDKVVINPLIVKIEKLNSEIFIQEKRLQKSLYLLSQEEFIISEHEKYTQHVKQVTSDGEEKSRLLAEIEKTARKASVLLKDVKLDLREGNGPYKKYIVEIETESKIAYLVDFIYLLEKSPQLLRVGNFYLTPIKDKSQILKAKMTITETLIVSK